MIGISYGSGQKALPPPAPIGSPQPLLCDVDEVAFLLNISRATAWKLDSTGRIPRPIRLGRRTLWSRSELDAWVAAGAPLRDRWESLGGLGK